MKRNMNVHNKDVMWRREERKERRGKCKIWCKRGRDVYEREGEMERRGEGRGVCLEDAVRVVCSV